MNQPAERPVAIVTGGTAGVGLRIAAALREAGYRVAIVGRDRERLKAAKQELASHGPDGDLLAVAADVSSPAAVQRLVEQVAGSWRRIDVLVNAVGVSDRGLAEHLSPEMLRGLMDNNVTTALLCSQACLPLLRESRGVIVNIGSLASKVGARYLGGYPAAKHALAGLTQQMRLELRPEGVHVGLVCPGPIRRPDAGRRYDKTLNDELPAQAAAPGAGTRVKGLDPDRVAQAVVRCIRRRRPEIILPGYLRVLIAIGNAVPPLGDWLLLKFTSRQRD